MKKVFVIFCVGFLMLFSACGYQMAGSINDVTEITEGISEPRRRNDVSFSTYENLISFFESGGIQTEYPELKLSDYDAALQEHVKRVSSGDKYLIIPYIGDSPVKISGPYPDITVFGADAPLRASSTWFDTTCEDVRVIIIVSEIPDPYKELSHTATCSQFLAEVVPGTTNLHNYKESAKYGVKKAYEKDIIVKGEEFCALIVESEGRTYTDYITDELYVSIVTYSGELTAEWLNQLHFKKVYLQNAREVLFNMNQ